MTDEGGVVVLAPQSRAKKTAEMTMLVAAVAMACEGEGAPGQAQVELDQAVLARRRPRLELKVATERTVLLPAPLRSFLSAPPGSA
jgi:hypothetical protein